MINPLPNAPQGFDNNLASVNYLPSTLSYDPARNAALRIPFNLNAGDVLVSAKSSGNGYPTYLRTVCALTVLSGPPAEGSFRPSIWGTDRSVRYNVNQMNLSVLKNYTAVASTPTKATITSQVPGLPWFEWSPNWIGNILQPTDNTADGDKQYGRETAMKFGQVGLWLNTNQPLADKRPIAIQIVQNGIDIHEYIKNGGGFYHDGGHKCGRKLPVVMAAMMMNDAALKTTAGNPDLFQEDQQTFFVKQSDVGRVVNMDYPGYVCSTYFQQDVGMAEWGIRHRFEPFQDNRTWATGYRTVVGPGMMPCWLAAYLMGAQTVWNHPAAFAYMERYHSLAGDGPKFSGDMYAAHKSGGTITPPVEYAATPVITPASGFFDAPVSVSISCATPSATIRYTLNGATPGTSDPVYSGPFNVTSTTTVKAIATATGMTNSSVATALLSFSASPPTFSPAPGGFQEAQSVTLTNVTAGATIRYTTDGSDPTANSPIYSAPIPVSATTTIKAIAIKPGIDTSPVITGIYAIGAFVGSQSWVSAGFDAQSAGFTYGFDMTPSSTNIDAVVGLGGVYPVNAYDQLACVIRFNSSGKIDARNGGGYAAVNDFTYSPGIIYTVRLIVDPIAKTYNATVAANGGAPVVIAQNYAFRLEQATLGTFNRMALFANIGSHTVMDYGLVQEAPSQPKGLHVVPPAR
jgi:hypothetical protein